MRFMSMCILILNNVACATVPHAELEEPHATWVSEWVTWSRWFLREILLVTSSWARSSFSCSRRMLASCRRRFSLWTQHIHIRCTQTHTCHRQTLYWRTHTATHKLVRHTHLVHTNKTPTHTYSIPSTHTLVDTCRNTHTLGTGTHTHTHTHTL